MFGLSRPVPITMKSSPRKNASMRGTASVKWPAAMMMPPTQMERCAPSSRSAIQPPGKAERYTPAV